MLMSTPLVQFDLPLEKLESYAPRREEPTDFDAFWSETLQATAAHPLDASWTPAESRLTALEAFDVSFRGYGGDVIRGWLLRDPDMPRPQPCIVRFLGYGSGRGSVFDHLSWASAGYATLVVESRGQGRWTSGVTQDPHDVDPHVPGWATQGIGSPDTYYYRRIYADAVRGVAVAKSHPEIDANQIVTVGRSQGGGIALAAAGLTDVAATVADVPYGCHFRRAIGLTPEAPYAEIAEYLRVHRDAEEAVMHTLSYFDGVNFAARACAPALFSAALMDQVCPPSTIFAARNHYAGPHELLVWPYNGHESGEQHQFEATLAFLDRVLIARPGRASAPRGRRRL
jgi:cephalosporin-C deacetylase